jgi:hypothetical protein
VDKSGPSRSSFARKGSYGIPAFLASNNTFEGSDFGETNRGALFKAFHTARELAIIPSAPPADSKRAAKRRRIEQHSKRAAEQNAAEFRKWVKEQRIIGAYTRDQRSKRYGCDWEPFPNDGGCEAWDSSCFVPAFIVKFTQRRTWYRSVAGYFGYQYDSFTYGSLGSEIRTLKLDEVAEEYHNDESKVQLAVNKPLYNYLYSEMLPANEYTKSGVFNDELVMVHMHKLTKQYYSKPGIKRKMDLAELQRDDYTMGAVASDTSKRFLQVRRNVTSDKLQGFLGACVRHRRCVSVGSKLLMGSAIALLLAHSAYSIAKNIPSPSGNMRGLIALELLKNASTDHLCRLLAYLPSTVGSHTC